MKDDAVDRAGASVLAAGLTARSHSQPIKRWIRRRSCAYWIAGALLAVLPAVARAQFTFTTNNGQITITGYTGAGGALTIPSKTNGYPVGAIAPSAFENNANLTTITIPGSVTDIGRGALSGCTKLTSITVHPTNSAYCGLSGVLFSKDQATLVAYPAGKGGYYTIPGTVTSIGDLSFYYCTKLTGITIPASVTSINYEVFGYCSGLTSIAIPNSVTSIGNWAFFECGNLARVYFMGNTPTLGANVFYNVLQTTVYYMPGTTNWSSTFGGCAALLWNPHTLSGDSSFGVRGNRFGFSIAGTAKIPISVTACADLANASWTSLQTCTLTNGLIYFSDPTWTNYSRRFYCIRPF
jgi:hypothetical protein